MEGGVVDRLATASTSSLAERRAYDDIGECEAVVSGEFDNR